ncbi:glycoside hydrolase family 76 protein [Microbacterium candidum]|uniref:Glycoside hydrolase family 76 protein n=1 Tax=Microbacterium candidum TaxID=3041922 RepID=A0ABT7MU28_9MICO|nr:glycoside hydrolase family 76 protein [Microbacterium sp. ASV49]MDL9977938.1 glycoside hydrolase family 76 protein [Microbacterium sp. ASV49]
MKSRFKVIAGAAAIAVAATMAGAAPALAADPAATASAGATDTGRAAPADANHRHRATNAVKALVGFYNPDNGRFDPGPSWWQTGNSLQVVLDYEQRAHDRSYLPLIEQAVQTLRAPQDWWPQGGGDFRTDSTDDTGWYALAMVRLYELTHDTQYLDIAKRDEAYIHSFWDDRCGGGVIWDIPSLGYKNAISNSLYLKLAASLHNAIPGDTYYLSRATETWDWFRGSGMINADHLVNDGLTDGCVNNGGTTWTYNQGVLAGALTELWKATGDRSLLTQARQIADATISSPALSPAGVLTEPCEATRCNSDQSAFKGIFARNIAELNDVLPGHPYTPWLRTQAATAYAADRTATDLYGLKWGGPFDRSDIGRQDSGASLMVAAM